MRNFIFCLIALAFIACPSPDPITPTPTPTPTPPLANEVELIQMSLVEEYAADLTPITPISYDVEQTSKMPGIQYGLKNLTGKNYDNVELELQAQNPEDKEKIIFTSFLGEHLTTFSYPASTIKVKSTEIEQIPVTLTLKSNDEIVKQWNIVISTLYAIQPTEQIIDEDGIYQYHIINKPVVVPKDGKTKRIYLYNSTAATLKINNEKSKIEGSNFKLNDSPAEDDFGFTNCYNEASFANASIKTKQAGFIDVKYVGGEATDETTLTITPEFRSNTEVYKAVVINLKVEE